MTMIRRWFATLWPNTDPLSIDHEGFRDYVNEVITAGEHHFNMPAGAMDYNRFHERTTLRDQMLIALRYCVAHGWRGGRLCRSEAPSYGVGRRTPVMASRLRVCWWLSPGRVFHFAARCWREPHRRRHGDFFDHKRDDAVTAVYPELAYKPYHFAARLMGDDARDLFAAALADPLDVTARSVLLDAITDDERIGKYRGRLLKVQTDALALARGIIGADGLAGGGFAGVMSGAVAGGRS